MSSIYYGQLTVSLFGQSHAPGIGVTVDGLPAGEAIDLEELQAFLNRRAPGRGPWATTRKEEDRPEILSGLAGGTPAGRPWRPSSATPTPGRGTMTTSETSPALATPTTPPR